MENSFKMHGNHGARPGRTQSNGIEELGNNELPGTLGNPTTGTVSKFDMNPPRAPLQSGELGAGVERLGEARLIRIGITLACDDLPGRYDPFGIPRRLNSLD